VCLNAKHFGYRPVDEDLRFVIALLTFAHSDGIGTSPFPNRDAGFFSGDNCHPENGLDCPADPDEYDPRP
jgi:hypothetical protein